VARRDLRLGFATPAAPGLVAEILIFGEPLFTGGEYEIGSAIDTFENPVLKFGHGIHP
jgi:hypothetical protein